VQGRRSRGSLELRVAAVVHLEGVIAERDEELKRGLAVDQAIGAMDNTVIDRERDLAGGRALVGSCLIRRDKSTNII
jgi:hypothetical protein